MPEENKRASVDTTRMNTRRIIWGVILAIFGVIFLIFWMMPVQVFGALTGQTDQVNGFFNGTEFASAANFVKLTFMLAFVLLFILAAFDFVTGAMGWGVVLPEKITVLAWDRLWSPQGLEAWDVLFTGKTTYTQCPKCDKEVQFVTQSDGAARQFTCLVCNHVEPMKNESPEVVATKATKSA